MTGEAGAVGYAGGMRKRLLDIALALALSVLLAPLILGLAAWLWLRQGRPILHLSERMRAPGRAFRLVKFRTMVPADGADGISGGHVAGRITPCGGWMRARRLDELPQLWNILRGDLGFVGPRPPLRAVTERFPAIYAAVLRSRPGVTGLASVVYHRHEERLLARCTDRREAEATYARACIPRKARLDLIHQRHAGLRLDLYVMLRTLRCMMRR